MTSDILRRKIDGLARALISATMLLFLTLAPSAVVARDRPGTPNGVYVGVCSSYKGTSPPTLCGALYNTAGSDEEVTFDMETMLNRKLVPNGMSTCDEGTGGFCWAPGARYSQLKAGNSGFGAPKVGIYFKLLDDNQFDVDYCVRFRARRTSDGVVSEYWSNWACTRTPAPPAKPAAPAVNVSFAGSQWVNGKSVPETMVISVPSGEPKGLSVAVLRGWSDDTSSGSAMSAVHGRFEYHIDPIAPELTINACQENLSGKSCSVLHADIRDQQVYHGSLPTGVIKHTGKPRGGEGRPPAPEDPRWNDWIGVWDASTSQGVAFKVTLFRDGDKLMGKFEDAPQPQYNGVFIQAGASLGMIYQFTYQQPTTGGRGTGGFVINKDGRDFNGEIKTADNPPVKVKWHGHKVSSSPN